MPDLPGHDVVEALGLVTATSAMSRNAFSDAGIDAMSVFGGSLMGVERAIATCTENVRQRLYAAARSLGADAVVGVTVRLEPVTDKAQAVLLAGTAVRTVKRQQPG